ncbi:unnamed protein product [Victoria cruziana]
MIGESSKLNDIFYIDFLDDAMAIFLALKSPELQVIGLTTIFGNVYTTLATRNALHLLEVAQRPDIPVAEGSHVTIMRGTKLHIANFVHGADGLGNTNVPTPTGKTIEQSAASFLVSNASLYPGQVTVVALGPMTNIALVFGDPDAADMVLTSGADILAIGINITHQVVMAGIYLHDPTTLVAAIDPTLFTYVDGIVRVQTTGIMRGLTVFDNSKKRYGEMSPWCDLPKVKVAVTVDAQAVLKLVKERLMN